MSSKPTPARLRTRRKTETTSGNPAVEKLLCDLQEQNRRLAEVTADLSQAVNTLRLLESRTERLEERLSTTEDDLRAAIYEIQDVLERQNAFPPKEQSYRLMVRRIREIVRSSVPSDGKLAVIGRPDRELLNINGRQGFCLPQTRDGEYAGYNPAGDTAAIVQLEAVRAKGAEYLLIPDSARWWLQHYTGFRCHLERWYSLLIDQPDTCTIFDLQKRALHKSNLQNVADALSKFENSTGHRAAVLDWNSGLSLAKHFPADVVFTPPAANPLPYLDDSVDVVVVSGDTYIEEATRVASAAVLRIAAVAENSVPGFKMTWKRPMETKTPSVSIVLPCFNQIRHTEICIRALKETLPPEFNGEIILVDDGSTDETQILLKQWAKTDKRFKVIRNPSNLGFIRSCNQAAAAATGDILIFLNNDTVPLPDWLTPILRVFTRYPDAGAAGGKLIYPEGRLQEAGGIVFKDGSAANFGRDDYNPDHPIYSFLREVDYCSAALLATPRELFEKLGRFDSQYIPAYYEDTDYCFRLRQNGYRVYYQPESAVIHFEGATCGLDLSEGVKRHQVINQELFTTVWHGALAAQPERPALADFTTPHTLVMRKTRQPNGTPLAGRALVCALIPEYDRDSGSRRILHLLEFLQEEDWAVTFVSHHAKPQIRYVRELQQRGIEVYCGDTVWIEHLVSTGVYDVAIFGLWDIAEPHIPVIRKVAPDTRVIVDSIDLHFLRNARHQFADKNEGRLGSEYAANMVRELNTYAAADAVLTVSDKEAGLINDLTAASHLAYTVPDTEDNPPASLPLDERKGIVFVGCFRHTPNADAIEYLLKEVVPGLKPALLEKHPLYIVGDGLDHNLRRLGESLDHVHMVGWTPSVIPYVRSARVSVVPLRYGAGTKRKVLESLLHGTPAVSTSVGAEGLDLEHGRTILIADSAANFADSITRILQDDQTWHDLARAGREHILSGHHRDVAQTKLRDILRTVLAKPCIRQQNHGVKASPSGRIGVEQYQDIIEQIRGVVETTVSAKAVIAIVSKGDDQLLKLGPRTAWHLPQDESGAYPGYHPSNSEEAVAYLRALENRGANHVLIPKPSLWWLDHYGGFTAYLEGNYERLVPDETSCAIYRMRTSPVTTGDVGSETTLPLSGPFKAKLIAFFLPQFHPIPENDGWWGKGFTEWMNVTRVQPLFGGHDQPRLPAELGYYDLRLHETRDAQANLAREHGIHGFCYYHYWFNGKMLLERPFAEVLESGKPDFPFCLCWANEPWSRRWDGQPHDVLQAQTYSRADDLAHIRWLLPALSDTRAIRIKGKPVFIVYQGKDLPEPARTIDLWREEANRAGVGELYLIAVETGWDSKWDATRFGFDAKLLFQPQFSMLFNSGTEIVTGASGGLRVFDYDAAWPILAKPEPVPYKRYDSVCVGWDNTARRGKHGVVLHGSTPGAYEKWLNQAIVAAATRPEDERLVFINAWNEWAEGCYLEPDVRRGRAYLEATRRAVTGVESKQAGR